MLQKLPTEEPFGRKLFKRVGGPALAIGSGALTLDQILPALSMAPSHGLALAGASVLVFGMVATVAGELWVRLGPRMDYYRPRPLKAESEISALQQVNEQFAPGESVPVEERMLLLARNPDLYYAIDAMYPGKKSVVVGYYGIYPLRKSAVVSIETGKRSRWYGAKADPEDIVTQRGRPSAFYVGFLWGSDRKGKAAVIKLVSEDLDRRCRKASVFKVFTRPMTEESLRLAKRFGFKNVLSDGPVELYRVSYRVWS